MTDKKLLAAMRADAAALDWGQAQPLWIAGGGGRGAPTVSIGDNGTGGGGGLSTRREDQAMTDKITIERETLEQFRDDVLHQRGPLAENGMTSDQVNDVLGLFDDAFCAALAAQPAEPVARVVPYGATVKLIWEDTAAAHNCKPGPLYAAPPAPAAVPPGWKLVPIEPTPGMIASGAVALVKASHSDIDPTMEEVTAAYRAMIAAVKPATAVPLTDAQIERLREATFSTNNPFCPVDSKSMRKAIRAAERAHGIAAAGDKP